MARGYKVWLCMDMSGGMEFRREIVQAATTSRCMAPLINDPWCLSGECFYEFKVALHENLKQGSPHIVPILADPTQCTLDDVQQKYPRVFSRICNMPHIVHDETAQALAQRLIQRLEELGVSPSEASPP